MKMPPLWDRAMDIGNEHRLEYHHSKVVISEQRYKELIQLGHMAKEMAEALDLQLQYHYEDTIEKCETVLMKFEGLE